MKFCPTCHRGADEALNYCSHDGSVLGLGDRFCPTCGHLHDRRFNYCPVHGFKLAWVPSDTQPLPPTRSMPARPPARAGRKALKGVAAAAASLIVFAGGALLGSYASSSEAGVRVEPMPAVTAPPSPRLPVSNNDARRAPAGAAAVVR
jgi:hypothetical protein